jgi:glycosyltransferase involved in cell wall biosynthesis
LTPLRVLHVVPHLDRIGGYERQAATLARHQHRRRSAEPILLTHGEPALPLFERTPEGEVHRLRRGLLRYNPSRWWRKHGGRVDVVHCHAMHKLSGQLLALAHESGLPSLVKVATEDDVAMFADPQGWEALVEAGHDDVDDGERGVRWRFMVRNAWRRLRRARSFVALNGGIAAQLEAHGLASVRLPNGVDVDRFRPPTATERARARERLALPTDACCLAYVGRLAPRKRVEDVLEAFLRLADRGSDKVHLVLAGEGSELPALQARAARSRHGRRITLLGLVDDVRQVLHAADVVAHPSRREGMPNAVLEAWSCGLATVLSDIPAHRAMLDGPGETPALLHPMGDTASLAARLAGLADAPARRQALGSAARGRALEHHAIDRIDRAYQRVYRSLTRKGGTTAGATS